MTALLIFHRDDASGAQLSTALTRAGVDHGRAVLADAAGVVAGSVRLVCIHQEPPPMTPRPGPRTVLAHATGGEHRFLLGSTHDRTDRFVLVEALLPDNPRTRHRVALHARAEPVGSYEDTPPGAGELPVQLIGEGAAALRTRLRQLADMQTTHVMVHAATSADLALIARAASDCALAVGDVDFLMQLIAYRRVRGWLEFQRDDSVGA